MRVPETVVSNAPPREACRSRMVTGAAVHRDDDGPSIPAETAAVDPLDHFASYTVIVAVCVVVTSRRRTRNARPVSTSITVATEPIVNMSLAVVHGTRDASWPHRDRGSGRGILKLRPTRVCRSIQSVHFCEGFYSCPELPRNGPEAIALPNDEGEIFMQ